MKGQPKIILASSSHIRRQLLAGAGVLFEHEAADLAEDEMMLDWQKRGLSADHVACKLAEAKAQKISAKHPDALVIGCDQMLVCDQRWFGRAESLGEAAEHLQFLRGRTHHLISAIAVVRNTKPVWDYADSAAMRMRNFSDAFLRDYAQQMGDRMLKSVGCYQLEGLGIQLFDDIRGDYFTILGLPLLPLLQFLREQGALAA